jgi:UDP-N-acetylglucosamine--N-acetylmuramyl-(pentapeptide) pyrophosphoryl-undecaprenol N-acetylglucosamine transferase
MERLKNNEASPNVRVEPFIHNMPEVLKQVDLVVGRAGATSIAEWTALGIPSILIPSPYVTNNHQEKNAQAIASKGAALMIKESECTGDRLLSSMDEILNDPEHWKEMHEASLREGIPDASARMLKLIESLIKTKKGDE